MPPRWRVNNKIIIVASSCHFVLLLIQKPGCNVYPFGPNTGTPYYHSHFENESVRNEIWNCYCGECSVCYHIYFAFTYDIVRDTNFRVEEDRSSRLGSSRTLLPNRQCSDIRYLSVFAFLVTPYHFQHKCGDRANLWPRKEEIFPIKFQCKDTDVFLLLGHIMAKVMVTQ